MAHAGQSADAIFELVGRNPLLDVALELERIALQDDYFVSRKLYPNSFDIFDWPRLMLGNGPPVVRARPTLPTSNGRLEVGCAGEERRWICSRSYAANTSSG